MCLFRTLSHPKQWGRVIVCVVLLAWAWQAQAVNLNQASLQQLQQIKGIGPKTAERIIHERDRAGPFSSLQDLSDRIKGIGPKRLSGLHEAGLTIEPMPAVPPADKNTKKQAK
ncbi:ComEA family DNA-binding protein [Paenalcaligenes hominis]|uniref:ComEA family DNA-binding protein n=1 Tax=Paenalcaligenes hominis TaxID=643674 RepID=UPI003525A497